MNTNTRLGLIAGFLLVISIWTYSDSVSRGDRFARGQKLLPNLNPDEVATILILDGEDTVTLRRAEDGFTVAENHDYPARNDAVNRFLRDLLDISLDKDVGTGDALEEELGLDPPSDSTTEITLSNATDQEMVHIRLGNSIEDGSGRYVQLVDGEEDRIYLTSNSAYLSTRADSFLKKDIVNVSQMLVRSVEGLDFLLDTDEEDSPVKLTAVPDGKKEKVFEINKLKGILSNLSFDKALLADDEEVLELEFSRPLEIILADDTSYRLSLATDGENNYMRVAGTHTVGRMAITLETPEDELKEKADRLIRADEIEDFNAFHASWVYKISTFTADKLKLRKADLLEDAD